MSEYIVNSFQVANAVVDNLMQTLSGNAFKCYLIIVRKTLGWGKTEDAISISRFQELSNIKTRNTVVAALNELEEVGLIKSHKTQYKTTVYQVVDGSNQELVQKIDRYKKCTSTKDNQTSTKNVPETSTKIVHTKHNIKHKEQNNPPTPHDAETEDCEADASLVAADATTADGPAALFGDAAKTPAADKPTKPDKPKAPVAELAALYNRTLGDALPRVQVLNAARKRQVAARWGEMLGSKAMNGRLRYAGVDDGLDWWRRFFAKVRSNPHWLGENDRGWCADFDWITKPANFAKILEFVPARRAAA